MRRLIHPHRFKSNTTSAHDSAPLHVSGTADFIDDLNPAANLLHLYIGGAPQIGDIQSIDLDAVRQSPGVVAVFTAKDIPGHKDIGPVFPGDVLLAESSIDYVGQPVFLVAANRRDDARRAARKADIQITPSQNITLTPTERVVRPAHTQTLGDVSTALDHAPHQLRGQLEIGGQEHFYLEGQAAQAQLDEDGRFFVQSSSQHPSEVQKLIAEVLDLPMADVVVQTRRMGGGFGGKETQAAPWAILCALATYHTGRPSRLRLSREDDFCLTGKRHPFSSQYTVGFDSDGKLLAAEHTLCAHCGYSPDLSDAIADRAMFHIDNAYYAPNRTVTAHRNFTHTVSHTAYRGFGGPQGMLACEAMMDDIAYALKLDPLELRLRNLYGEHGDTTHYGQTVSNAPLKTLMTTLAEQGRYAERREAINAFNQQHPYKRRGLALTPVKFGISFTVSHLNQAGALIHLYTDGSIHLNHGGTEMGQGLFRKVSQVVAHEFGVDLSQIRAMATRTDKVPNTSPTAASSGSDLNGMAALDACHTLKTRLTEHFIDLHGGDIKDVIFANSHVSNGSVEMSFSDLVQSAYLARISLSSTGFYRTPKIHYDRQTAKGRPFYYYACGAALCEVEIDTLTGEYHVSHADLLQDVGRSLNPDIDRGQIEGGFIQGMGWLTTEELVWGNDGRLLTRGPATYKIPAIGDAPEHFTVSLLDRPNDEATIYHSKAVGEPPFMLGIAVYCALRNAVASLSANGRPPQIDTPATAERILKACHEAKHAVD